MNPCLASADQPRRRRCLLAGAGALAGLATGGLPHGVLAAPARTPALGEPVAWPALTLLDGSSVSPGSLRDTALVLVFFETTCPYCRRHNAHVDKLVRATRGQPLRVIGVAGDGQAERVRDHVRQQGYGFGVTLDDGALRALFTPRRVIPLTCVLDRAGLLRELIPGEMTESDVLGLARWAGRT